MFSYHYYSGAEGRRYCYASRAKMRCPFAEGPPGWFADDLFQSSDADVRSIDIELVWRNAHTARQAVPHEAGRCRACGARLHKVGYAAWIEEPWPDEDAVAAEARERARADGEDEERAVSSALSTMHMNQRLGSSHRERPGSLRYFGLKREAMGWAREEADIDKAAFVAAL